MSLLKRVLVGRPLATEEQHGQRLPKVLALPTFSSDAISSTAYATEQILFVTALGGSSLALGLSKLVPISIVVALLLALVVVSYRQTIFAYPSGGGSYIVSRENLGRHPSLVAGASLLIDYVLTVAVSISAGVAAIVSLPALRGLVNWRVEVGLALIAVITLTNLRGLKTSGAVFAVPMYTYVIVLTVLVGYGLARSFFGHIAPVPFHQSDFEGRRLMGGSLGLFLILRGFSSGAVALTGIEAISNGVPAFRPPESRNAAITMAWMGTILGTLFFGVSVLAHHLKPYPSRHQTVLSQLGLAVFGNGPVYVLLQVATAAILTLAANTSYADFPRLSSIIARDGFLPRRMARRGDRLVFSNGILVLAAAAAVLIIVFRGKTDALVPLYAVGVFTAFTLSQFGMVRHHQRLREARWRRGLVLNAVGGTATLLVLVVIAVSKFTEGAWIPVVLVPVIVAGFLSVRRHYDRLARDLAVAAPQHFEHLGHTVVVLVARIDQGTIRALEYARSLRPDHIVALHVLADDEDPDTLQREWDRVGVSVPLEVLDSPFRELVGPLERRIDDLRRERPGDVVTVVMPEIVLNRWQDALLHSQSAELLRERLMAREGVVVASVPYGPESSA